MSPEHSVLNLATPYDGGHRPTGSSIPWFWASLELISDGAKQLLAPADVLALFDALWG
jgi:hypothetical protein